MFSDAGGRLEVQGMTGHPTAVCSRVWLRRRQKNDDRQLTNGIVERAADASYYVLYAMAHHLMLALGSCTSRVGFELLLWMCNLGKLTETHML